MCKQLIIAISGRKSAGKNVLSTYLSRYYAYRKCYPHTNFIYDAAKTFLQTNETLYNYIQNNVGIYSFADSLKEFCIETLGLDRTQCYGTEEQKNTPTPYSWENIEPLLYGKFVKTFGEKTGFITAREVMQLFGTELIRHTFGNVWASSTVRRIRHQRKPLALVCDLRFSNECDVVLSNDGYIIRLTRTPFGYHDGHESEKSLDEFDWNREHCFVIDNQKMSEDAQNKAATEIIESLI